MIQQHLLTFEQSWTDKSDGRTLPSFVTGELQSSHRSQCVPVPVPQTQPEQADKPGRSLPLSLHISWSELLRRTFHIDTTCPRCKSPLRLISLTKTDENTRKILTAMGLPTKAPEPYPARPPPSESGGEGGGWLN